MHCNTDADGAKKGTKTPAPQQLETLMSPTRSKARHHDAELRGPLGCASTQLMQHRLQERNCVTHSWRWCNMLHHWRRY